MPLMETTRLFLLNRCCNTGLLERIFSMGGRFPYFAATLRSPLYLGKCKTCVVKDEHYNAMQLCNAGCCQLNSDCLKTYIALIKEDRDIVRMLNRDFLAALNQIINPEDPCSALEVAILKVTI